MNLFEQATADLQDALSKNPDQAELHNQLGVLYYKQKDFDKALQHYVKATNLKPDFAEAHFNLGLLFIQQGKIEFAIKQFHNVETLLPEFVPALRYLADLSLQIQDYNSAKYYYEQIIEANAVDADVLNNLGVVYLKQEIWEEASQYFGKALIIDEDHLDARSNLAAVYLQNERYDNAMRNYQEFLTHKPDDIESNYNLGVAAMAVGELKIAVNHFEKVLTIDNNNIDAMLNLAAVKLKLTEKTAAIKLYHEVLHQNAVQSIARYMLQALEGGDNPESAPKEYVENLFDNYAGYYEKHINEVLQYSVPDAMGRMLAPYLEALSLRGSLRPKQSNLAILDLGCGSGLAAEKFAAHAKTIIGIDLSKKMLKQAERKNIYTELIHADLITGMQQLSQQFDLIIAADVFVYIGSLEEIFSLVKSHLKPGGLFCFSTETAGANYQLLSSARYAHASEYITTLAIAQGLSIIEQQSIIPRYQENQPVAGMLYLLKN